MREETKERIVTICGTVLVFIIAYFMIATIPGMFIYNISGEEKAEIRQLLIDYEYCNLDEEDLNLISDLDIHIKEYTDGSYLVSKDGHTLLYASADDTYPIHDYPSIIYQLKSNFEYLVVGILIILGMVCGFIIGKKHCYEDSDEEDYSEFEEVEPERDEESQNQEE